MFEDQTPEGTEPAPTPRPQSSAEAIDPFRDWRETAPDGVPEADLRRAVAVATLFGADDSAEAEQLMTVVFGDGPDSAADRVGGVR
ncbi:hypothetical protein [Nocardia sp. NPDC004750]